MFLIPPFLPMPGLVPFIISFSYIFKLSLSSGFLPTGYKNVQVNSIHIVESNGICSLYPISFWCDPIFCPLLPRVKSRCSFQSLWQRLHPSSAYPKLSLFLLQTLLLKYQNIRSVGGQPPSQQCLSSHALQVQYF